MGVKCQSHKVCSKRDWSVKYGQSQNIWPWFLAESFQSRLQEKADCFVVVGAADPIYLNALNIWKLSVLLCLNVQSIKHILYTIVYYWSRPKWPSYNLFPKHFHLHHHVGESNILVDVSGWWEYHVARLVYHDGESIMLAFKWIMLMDMSPQHTYSLLWALWCTHRSNCHSSPVREFN